MHASNADRESKRADDLDALRDELKQVDWLRGDLAISPSHEREER